MVKEHVIVWRERSSTPCCWRPCPRVSHPARTTVLLQTGPRCCGAGEGSAAVALVACPALGSCSWPAPGAQRAPVAWGRTNAAGRRGLQWGRLALADIAGSLGRRLLWKPSCSCEDARPLLPPAAQALSWPVAPRSRPGTRRCQAAALSRSLPAGSWSLPRVLLRVTAPARRREGKHWGRGAVVSRAGGSGRSVSERRRSGKLQLLFIPGLIRGSVRKAASLALLQGRGAEGPPAPCFFFFLFC